MTNLNIFDNNRPTVFISHSSEEINIAEAIAKKLGENGIGVLLDSQSVQHGDSIVSFMENSISSTNYFLLLWSKTASQKKWVKIEWEAALTFSLTKESAFLITARLEDYPLPNLLAPRLWIDMFPRIDDGVKKLLGVINSDISASHKTGKNIAPAKFDVPGSGTDNVYVSSELFSITLPLTVDFTVPIGVCLGHLINSLDLPTIHPIDEQKKIMVRVLYTLWTSSSKLENNKTFIDAGIKAGEVLYLQTEFSFITATNPISVSNSSITFRGKEKQEPDLILSEELGSTSSLVLRSINLLRGYFQRAGVTKI